jgi:hypothetical protein
MSRAFGIAYKVRLYRLLNEHPEYMTTDREELIRRMLDAPVPLGELDKTLLLHTSELDRVCAHAVRVLTNGGSTKTLLDALGMMDADRIVAVYHALPPKRRVAVLRDPVWAYHVGNAPPETEAAVAEVSANAEGHQALAADRARLGANEASLSAALRRLQGYEREALRHEGDPVGQVLAAFLQELGALGAAPDDDAFAAACARAAERCRV